MNCISLARACAPHKLDENVKREGVAAFPFFTGMDAERAPTVSSPFSSSVGSEPRALSVRLGRREEKDVLLFSVKGEAGRLFSLDVCLGALGKVLYGRFDREGKAQLSLTVPGSETRRWRIDEPHLYEGSALLLAQGREERLDFRLGRAAYTRRKAKNGHILLDKGEPLRILGLFADLATPSFLAAVKEAGVSLLLYPLDKVTEALLGECDALGLGVAACVRLGRRDSLAALAADAEGLLPLVKRHPSLLYLSVFYEKDAHALQKTVDKMLSALLSHHGSRLSLWHLPKQENTAFYTDLPLSLSEKEAEEACAMRCGWKREDFRSWLYGSLLSGFFSSSARYLFLPEEMGSPSGLSLIWERRRLGFAVPQLLVRQTGVFPFYGDKALLGAAVTLLLEKDGWVIAEGRGRLDEGIGAALLSLSPSEKPTVYRLHLFIDSKEEGEKGSLHASAAVVLLPAKNAYSTCIDGLPLGEYRLGERAAVAKAEDCYFLAPTDAALPPLLSLASPLASTVFRAEGYTPLWQSQKGDFVLAVDKEASCLASTLLLTEKDGETAKNGEKSPAKNDFFENFF